MKGKTYEEMADANQYSPDYFQKDIGNKFWKKLSQALGEKVSKTNFRAAIERKYNSVQTTKNFYNQLKKEDIELTSDEIQTWQKEKTYGQFIGRSEELQELAIEAGLNDYLPFLRLLEAGKFLLLDDLENACPLLKETFYMAVEQNDYETLLETYRLLNICLSQGIAVSVQDMD